jgi:hypothetical protein
VSIDSLVEYVSRTLRGNPHVTQIVAFALDNARGAFNTSSISAACSYFDQHSPRTMQALYGESYAKAILSAVKALEKFSRPAGGLSAPFAKPLKLRYLRFGQVAVEAQQ